MFCQLGFYYVKSPDYLAKHLPWPAYLVYHNFNERLMYMNIIKNITIVCVESGTLQTGMDVIIEGDIIKKIFISKKLDISGEIDVFDGTDKYLLPGLFDMHAHIHDGRYLPLFLLNGITAIRETGNDLASIYKLKKESRRVRSQIPRLYIAGPIIEGDPPYWGDAFKVVHTINDVAVAVDQLVEKNVDFIKCYHTLSHKLHNALLSEAVKSNLKVTGHLPIGITAQEAYQKGQSCVEHMFDVRESCFDTIKEDPGHEYDSESWKKLTFIQNTDRANNLFRIMKSKKAAICPTLYHQRQLVALRNYKDAVRNTVGYEYTHKATRDEWSEDNVAGNRTLFYDNLQRMVDAEESIVRSLYNNSLMLAGTDTEDSLLVPGFSLIEELVTMVDCGLTPLEALRTATVNPALYLEERYLGRVQEGSIANLVIYESNPLENINHLRKVNSVILNGTVISRSELETAASTKQVL